MTIKSLPKLYIRPTKCLIFSILNRDLSFQLPQNSAVWIPTYFQSSTSRSRSLPYHDSYSYFNFHRINYNNWNETVKPHNFSPRLSILSSFFVFAGASSRVRFAIIIPNGVREMPLHHSPSTHSAYLFAVAIK